MDRLNYHSRSTSTFCTDVSPEFHRHFPDWTVVRTEERLNGLSPGSEVVLWRDNVGMLTLSRTNDLVDIKYRLRFSDQIAVDISFTERIIVETATLGLSLATRDHFLLDQVLPRMLAHQGKLILHAGSVNYRGQAIVILGKSGSGKSTLAASFGQSHASLMGDDACIVSLSKSGARIESVYPSLRLLSDSVEQFFPGSTTKEVAHYTSKQRVQLEMASPADSSSLPICAIMAISERPSNDLIEIRDLSVADGCMAIISNSFMLDPSDMPMIRHRLDEASALAAHVHVSEIAYPHDYARLPEVRAAIFDHLV